MTIYVNAIGESCPIPIVKTRNAIKELNGNGCVETLVDNEIAVQNLEKFAHQKGYGYYYEQIAERQYKVIITVGDNLNEYIPVKGNPIQINQQTNNQESTQEASLQDCDCKIMHYKDFVLLITNNAIGNGDKTLGSRLMKNYIYTLTQQEQLPSAIIFMNEGAKITCEESESLEDLEFLTNEGVEILTCGTCLDFYQLKEKLKVGSVTNMYEILERTVEANKVITL